MAEPDGYRRLYTGCTKCDVTLYMSSYVCTSAAVLEDILYEEELKIDTPRINKTKQNIKYLLEASGATLEAFEKIMLIVKEKVSSLAYTCNLI